jgi:hypothetical protein
MEERADETEFRRVHGVVFRDFEFRLSSSLGWRAREDDKSCSPSGRPRGIDWSGSTPPTRHPIERGCRLEPAMSCQPRLGVKREKPCSCSSASLTSAFTQFSFWSSFSSSMSIRSAIFRSSTDMASLVVMVVGGGGCGGGGGVGG